MSVFEFCNGIGTLFPCAGAWSYAAKKKGAAPFLILAAKIFCIVEPWLEIQTSCSQEAKAGFGQLSLNSEEV